MIIETAEMRPKDPNQFVDTKVKKTSLTGNKRPVITKKTIKASIKSCFLLDSVFFCNQYHSFCEIIILDLNNFNADLFIRID